MTQTYVTSNHSLALHTSARDSHNGSMSARDSHDGSKSARDSHNGSKRPSGGQNYLPHIPLSIALTINCVYLRVCRKDCSEHDKHLKLPQCLQRYENVCALVPWNGRTPTNQFLRAFAASRLQISCSRNSVSLAFIFKLSFGSLPEAHILNAFSHTKSEISPYFPCAGSQNSISFLLNQDHLRLHAQSRLNSFLCVRVIWPLGRLHQEEGTYTCPQVSNSLNVAH